MSKNDDDLDVIEISEEEVKLNIGSTRIVISGILSKRHAQILAFLILAMLGFNHEMILDMI